MEWAIELRSALMYKFYEILVQQLKGGKGGGGEREPGRSWVFLEPLQFRINPILNNIDIIFYL